MKRFTKGVLGFALILLGIGCILIAAGRKKSDFAIFVTEQEYNGEPIVTELTEVNRIHLDIPYGYIIMEQTDAEVLTYGTEKVEQRQLTIKEDAGEFSITAKPEEKTLGKSWIDLPVYYIGIPKDYQGSISVHIDAGKLELDGVNANALNTIVSFGEIELREVEFETVTLQCYVGSVIAEGSFHSLFSGTMTAGELIVRPDGEAEDYAADVACIVGELIYDGSRSGGIKLDKKQEKVNSRLLKLDVKVGSIEVKFNK